ncbi:MAG: ribonuclease P protein component [bacterium]
MTRQREQRPSQSWPKSRRLRKRWEYLAVQQSGQRRVTSDLVILWRATRRTVSRLGVTVSRKVAKQATQRNRIKRLIREVWRTLPVSDQPPLDVAVIARPRAVKATYQAIRRQLEVFWKQVGHPADKPSS